MAAGWAIVAAAKKLTTKGGVSLGTELDAPNLNAKSEVESRVGVTVRSDSLRKIIEDLLYLGDDAKADRWNALRASSDKVHRIFLGGKPISERAVISGGATFTDNFNRPDEPLTAGNWQRRTGPAINWAVISNQAGPDASGSTSVVQYSTLCDTDDNYSEFTVVTNAGYYSPLCRLDNGTDQSTLTGYALWRDTGTLYLQKLVNEVGTTLASAGTYNTFPLTLKVEANGSTIKGYANGSAILTVTDTGVTTGKRVGARTYTATGMRIDDWSGGDVAAVGQPTVLRTLYIPGGAGKRSQGSVV